jgi:hypothetical protein
VLKDVVPPDEYAKFQKYVQDREDRCDAATGG